MSNQLTTEEASTLKKNAEAYFKEQGIDPSKKPEKQSSKIDEKTNLIAESLTTYACLISIVSVFFYTYCEVIVPKLGYKFKGSAGGVGAGGFSGPGIIYFSDKSKLLSTHTFGVAYAADDGGLLQVTWGSHGNATATGVGAGGGAFGGSGKWEKI